MEGQLPQRLCGRALSQADVEAIRREVGLADPRNRAEIARRVCRVLDWTNAVGEPKLMSARVGLLLRQAKLGEGGSDVDGETERKPSM